ncbi:MAG: hypothetical protein HOI57_15500 [Rhodospirillaceae bacterium]|nr:hypothetical protein [Rhodospirillaceae bacterium]MBT5770813.1 hypothetical protein [Rhodospirillaceae bacterium]MBT6404708.1 hypothetical protein [Rhodospirillaceae bacterium]MBT6537443.1 hypothetical protein [Rhodospirillaceae bacterium]
MTTQPGNRKPTKLTNLTFGANLTFGVTLGVGVLLVGLGVSAGPAWSQTPVATPAATPASTPATRDAGTLSHDCTDVTIDYADEPGLTREERIARMDRAFQRSLGRFEECQSERAGTGGGSGGGSGGGTGGDAGTGGGDGTGELSGTEAAGTDAGGSESSGAETSTAASDISGPDAAESAPAQEGSSTAASDVTGDAPTVSASTTAPNQNGKWTRPDDIESPEDKADSPARDEPVREAARTQGGGKVPEDIPPADNDSALEAQIRQAAIEETDPELKKRLWDEYRRYKGLPVSQ